MMNQPQEPAYSNGSRLISRETPEELFRGLVQDAIHVQHLHPSDMAEYYMVSLLSREIRGALKPLERAGDPLDETLAGVFLKAEVSRGETREELLRSVGDHALFISGFFSESLSDSIVGARYYHSMGRMAYARLADEVAERSLNDLFAELADHFTEFVGVLGEVSERSAAAQVRSTLVLYEKWLTTRSATAGRRLCDNGVFPVAGALVTMQ